MKCNEWPDEDMFVVLIFCASIEKLSSADAEIAFPSLQTKERSAVRKKKAGGLLNLE